MPSANRLGHAAEALDLLDQGPGLFGELGGQRLDIIGAAKRISHIGYPALFRENQWVFLAIRAEKSVGSGHRLVEAVGVQRLVAAEHRCHRLDRGAHDVVHRVLLGEGHPGRLQWVRSSFDFSVFAPNASMIRCQSRRAARSFATSMKKFMPMPKKKLSRGAKWSTSSPLARAART